MGAGVFSLGSAGDMLVSVHCGARVHSKGIALELTLLMLVRHGLLTATSEPCCLGGGGVIRLPAWGDSTQGTSCQHYPAYS